MPKGKYQPIGERFLLYVDQTPGLGPKGDCWEWTGARIAKRGGYGMTSERGIKLYAHRVAWELENGPIPEGLLVLHRCDNPPCVREDHLFLGTKRDNARDMESKGRGNGQFQPSRDPYCKNGHLRSLHSITVGVRRVRRACRQCVIERKREYRSRQRDN